MLLAGQAAREGRPPGLEDLHRIHARGPPAVSGRGMARILWKTDNLPSLGSFTLSESSQCFQIGLRKPQIIALAVHHQTQEAILLP
jgi:hypothetical protein